MMSTFIGRVVSICSRHAWTVVVIYVFLAIASVLVTVNTLDITTDTTQMFSAAMPWKQRSDWMARNFPQKENLLVALIQSNVPEKAEVSAQSLVASLKNDKKHFDFVRYPEADPFLVQNGLLYLDPATLDQTLNKIIQAQPFLSGLAFDPSARGLFEALDMVVLGVKEKQVDFTQYNDALDAFATTLNSVAQGQPQYFSWEKSLSGSLSDLSGKYKIVIAKPKLNLNTFQPAGAAVEKLRQTINHLPYVRDGSVSIHITGDAKLSDEEFSTVMQGMVVGLFASFVLVAGWLFLAVRTWNVIFSILFVLFIGLVLTTGFASVAVGTLNLISVSFAILFVSIAVDFGIQFSVRFRGQTVKNDQDVDIDKALVNTGRETGHQIFTAAVSAAAGFLAFTPTQFTGVRQLGLIAGGGMLIAFVCTITLLPALLKLFKPKIVQSFAGFPQLKPIDKKIRRYRAAILFFFSVLGAVGLFLFVDQRVVFDSDPFHTKDSRSEGMKTLKLMMNDSNTTPYTIDIMVDSPQKALELTNRLENLSTVKNVIWLDSFIPQDQAVKLPMIHDAADILLPTLTVQNPKPKPTASELRQSVKTLLNGLLSVQKELKPDQALYQIMKALEKIDKLPDASLEQMNDRLIKFLPLQLQRLQLMLNAKATRTEDIPQTLTSDYKTKSGQYRVEVYPKGVNLTPQQITAFVRQIQSVAPQAAGTCVDIVESAATVVHAFLIAAAMAIITLAIILYIALRRILDMVLVLIPLILSALITVIVIVVSGQMLNFANIITLPLFLGVGVSFNIYFVMNWREGIQYPLSSPTARAVLFSALTTGTAFGSLACSAHPGTASMGVLLLISLASTLMVTLGFVPALLPKRDVDDF
ncbi:hypothetical protein COMNV_00725 [Commensalibacter sp. Nvir]|uniref:MMPL family transporter n=1 Tax=Commensalibacter sp. Nvir TaxID=3069817 RepID=UPI002D6E2BFA|nr:hypothetical protein COMNV_00725 [Commensalibacter sp. Nvir]